MKNLTILLLGLGMVGLVACNGGGSSGGGGGTPTPVSQYPVGYCIQTTSNPIANPAVIPGATRESVVYSYNNDGSFLNGTAVEITYAGLEFDPIVQTVDYALAKSIDYTNPLPAGVCAMSPANTNTYLPNTTMYFSNCTAEVTNGILNFNSTYSIYESGIIPGTGAPISSGTFNFTCPFSTF